MTRGSAAADALILILSFCTVDKVSPFIMASFGKLRVSMDNRLLGFRILNSGNVDVLKTVNMKSTLFGEALTWMEGNRLVQITWKSQQGFIYDANTLDQIDEFTFDTTKKQGWGITWDACKGELIMEVNFCTFGIRKLWPKDER